MKPIDNTTVRRVVAGLSVAGLLTLGACGSDGGGNGGAASTEAFCAQLGEVSAGDGSSIATDLQSLAEAAPDAISDDMQAFANLFNEMDALSTDTSDEAAAQLAGKMGEFGDLTGRLDAWSNENCPDLPTNVFTQN